MSLIQHGVRVALLMATTLGLLWWLTLHSEVTFADGLRYIHQAEQIDKGAWSDGILKAVDHPLHPIAIAAVHDVIGGEGPIAWQRSAQAASILASVLLIIPLYLLTLEIYGPSTAWLGALLFMANPIVGFVTINLLSECTFLLFWTWGLWAAVRFLREGRFSWLPLTIGFSALAYLARPEGMLLPLALVATLFVLPLHWATRIYWPRWWMAVAFLVVGPLLLAGPFMAAKGGIGTKPSIARLIGTAPKAPPTALEREKPLPADQTTFQTYRYATHRMFRVMRASVTSSMLPLSLLGLIVAWPWSLRARVWLFSGILLVLAAVGLVRLHATGGYLTIRHAIVPGMLLTLAAANGLAWLMRSVVIEGRWIGLGRERFRPGPAVWAALLALLVALPHASHATPAKGCFDVYHEAGAWIAAVKAHDHGKVLDVTDWALYFSQSPGFRFSEVNWAAIDPTTRWIVARDAHIRGRFQYSRLVNDLIGGRQPVVTFPSHPVKGRLQIKIFDRRTPPPPALAGPSHDRGTSPQVTREARNIRR